MVAHTYINIYKFQLPTEQLQKRRFRMSVWKFESLRKIITFRGPRLEQVGPISIKLHRNVPMGTPILIAQQNFDISFLRLKTAFLDPKLISLPIWNMFNQILSNLAIMFLLVPFALLLKKFFPISIFKVKNSVFLTQILNLFPFGTCSTKFLQNLQ